VAELSVVKGSVWDSRADLVIITTNGTITTSTDRLVMNVGSAYEAAKIHTWLPSVAAKVISSSSIGLIGKKWLYGFTVIEHSDLLLGLFQSKLDWEKPAVPAVIGLASVQLALWLQEHPRIKKVALHMPGQGLIGGLEQTDVMPLLNSVLPAARVKVYVGPILGE
jgi:hypothetical protein